MSYRVALAILCSSTIFLAGLPAASEPVPWDAEKVSELARKLATEVSAIDRVMRSGQLGDQSRRDFYRLRETVRRMRNETRRLADLLEAGSGHDETLPIFEQLGVQVRDAREIGNRMFITTGLQARFAAARAVLDELAKYYDAHPLPPPRPRG